jgi:D-alanyl-D-alanine carboxypeptidase (penicillin-binding protein 5/6)
MRLPWPPRFIPRGSVEAFVERMNAEALALGLSRTHFVDPSGYSEFNLTTGARFCHFLPDIPPSDIPKRSCSFIREGIRLSAAKNLPETFQDKPGTVHQNNRNLLLGETEGVDGLKTGYTPESGYNIALTAKRGETRLLAVLLGGPAPNSAQGVASRAEDGGRLLDWGFAHFRTIRPVVERLDPIHIWKGKRNEVALVPAEPWHSPLGTIERRRSPGSCGGNQLPGAPIAAGDVLAELVFSDQFGELPPWVPLAAGDDVEAGSLWKRAIDAVVLFFLKLFGRI